MEDIKAYYKKQNEDSSSKSSSFQYEETKKEDDNLGIEDEKQNLLVKKFDELKDVDKETDNSLQSEAESILDQFNMKNASYEHESQKIEIAVDMNEDLKDIVGGNNEENLSDNEDAENYTELFSKNIKENSSSGNSPIVDHSRPESTFESAKNHNKNSPDASENLEIPSKPIIRDSEKDKSTIEVEANKTPQKEDISKFEDPQLTPEESREQKNENEENGKLIADQILHMLL